MFPDEDAELAELEPEAAAEELARRLAEYRRAKEGAEWLARAARASRDRYFRLVRRRSTRAARAASSRPEPPRVSPTRCARWRRSRRRSRRRTWRSSSRRWRSSSNAGARCFAAAARLDFDQEVAGLSRVEVAVAFLALLELAKQQRARVRAGRTVRPDQDFPTLRRKEPCMDRPLRLVVSNPVEELARTIEALLVVASLRSPRRSSSRRPATSRTACPRRSKYWPSATARDAAGSCSSTSPAASRSAPRARRPRRARGSSTGRSSGGCQRGARDARDRRLPRAVHPARHRPDPRRQRRRRRRRPRRARPRWPSRAATTSSAPSATRRRRSSSASSASSRWPSCRGSTTSAPTRRDPRTARSRRQKRPAVVRLARHPPAVWKKPSQSWHTRVPPRALAFQQGSLRSPIAGARFR